MAIFYEKNVLKILKEEIKKTQSVQFVEKIFKKINEICIHNIFFIKLVHKLQ